jgi:hypothetical protein
MYHNAIVLVNVLEIEAPTDATARFARLDQPTYLELVNWASVAGYPATIQGWEQFVDW